MMRLILSRSTDFILEDETKRKILEEKIKKIELESNDIELMFCLNYGIGMNRDEAKAKEICIINSDKGNLIARGFRYYMGWDCARDVQKSFHCFENFIELHKDIKNHKVIHKEMGYCLNMIAYFYKEGKAVEKNVGKTIELYKRSIKLGNSMAMNNLAYLYKSGKGVKKDMSKAIRLYERAINLGNISSMYNLAYLYEEGRDVEQNIYKAIKLYKMAIKMGNSMAMNNLAMIFKNGKGVKKNVEKAILLYLEAIGLKNKNAMYNLAYLFEEGKEVEKNLNRAVELYSKSCDMGNSSAMNNLAMIFKRKGGEKNLVRSLSLFEQATDLGNKNAMINLALVYEEESAIKNYEKSAYYFHQLYLYKDDNQQMFKRKLVNVLSSRQVNWTPEYHPYWCSSTPQLNDQIKTLLLVCKNRRESKRSDLTQIFVRGITFFVIKYLCHFNQIRDTIKSL